MCDCADDIKSIKDGQATSQRHQATLAFSLMQISEALIALCDREANARRILESSRKLREGMPKLRAIVEDAVPARDDELEDTKPGHKRARISQDDVDTVTDNEIPERDTRPSPPPPPEED